MHELKHVQRKFREVFTTFEHSKHKLIEILESAKKEPIPSLHNTVSMINLDTQILIPQSEPDEWRVSNRGIICIGIGLSKDNTIVSCDHVKDSNSIHPIFKELSK